MKFTEEDAHKLMQEMENAPPKVRPLSIREFILRLAPSIDEMRGKGYTWDDVVQFLKGHGVETSVGSLRGYLSAGARKKKGKQTPTRKRAPRETGLKAEAVKKQDSSVQQSESVPQEQSRKEEKPVRRSGLQFEPDPDII